jgi:Ca-activated chloride channel family protein
MYSFQNIEYFFAFILLLLPVSFFIWILFWKKKIKQKLGDVTLIDQLSQAYSSTLFRLKFILILSSLSLLILSGANLRSPLKKDIVQRNGIDIMIAIDVSKSMLSEDVSPSRIEKAKFFADKLITEISSNNQVGLVVFAGEPFLQMPVTTDLSKARMYINGITTNAAPMEGTDIGDALQLCDTSLNLHERKHKAIILITDGEDHNGTAIANAKRLSENGVVVFTVGVGSSEGSFIKDENKGDYIKDENGKVVISKLDEDLLKKIATITNGEYFALINQDSVTTDLIKAMSKLESKSYITNSNYNFTSYYQVFLIIALVLFIAEIFIPEVKTKVNIG